MLLLSFFYFFSREIFFTSHLTQLALSLSAVSLLSFRIARTPYHALLATVAMILSKSYIDFSSSGLENALTHLIMVSFCIVYFRHEAKRRLLYLTLILSATMLTRLDTVLFYLPPMALELTQRWRKQGERPPIKEDIKVLALG